jgi:hypothetical protein
VTAPEIVVEGADALAALAPSGPAPAADEQQQQTQCATGEAPRVAVGRARL